MDEILKGKTILIGKEPGQGRLLVHVKGVGQTAAIGLPGCVPSCVSRCKPSEEIAHAQIVVDADGNFVLTNMKPQNVTFVNGSEIASKRITPATTVELGRDRFTVSVPKILETAQKILVSGNSVGGVSPLKFNISHLRGVWDRYEQEIDRIVDEQRDIARKRMLPIMVGSLSGVACPILAAVVGVETFYVTIPVAAISFALYFINYRKKDTSYEERKAATESLIDEYICPNCKKFVGNISYKLLKKQYSMHCPNCKCDFEE